MDDSGPGGNPLMVHEAALQLPAGGALLGATLAMPDHALGVIAFAHGSGSSRHSPRNRWVAGRLQQSGFGTLLMDLLTEDEERAEQASGHLRFDIELLGGRLGDAIQWLCSHPRTRGLGIGLFGASTGAAAALLAAAAAPGSVRAIVSRGGRPDLAIPRLGEVRAPTLLIVGGDDHAVIQMNREALEHLVAPAGLEIVPGATHLFGEPGALETVAQLASAWFTEHLPEGSASGAAG